MQKRKYSRRPMADRFWEKTRESESGCLEWQAACYPNGYGIFAVDCTPKAAHRVAYELSFGKICEGRVVCHTCDNKKCVNPNHLFIGTQKDNINDMHNKGRAAKGFNLPHTRLSEDQVIEVVNSTKTAKETADIYGITPNYVYQLKHNYKYGIKRFS